MSTRELAKKICLLGDGAVGKTSLIRKFVYDEFDDKYISTIGAKVTKKPLELKDSEGNKIKLTLMIYDLLGQKDFQRLHSVYYRGSHGTLVVCDITRKETLQSLMEWKEDIFKVTGEIPAVYLANKVDLKDQAAFTEEQFREILQESDSYFKTSAKTGENVEEAFVTLSKLMCSDMLEEG